VSVRRISAPRPFMTVMLWFLSLRLL